MDLVYSSSADLAQRQEALQSEQMVTPFKSRERLFSRSSSSVNCKLVMHQADEVVGSL